MNSLRIKYYFVFILLFTLMACTNDATKSYEKLRSEYEIIFANNNSYSDIIGYIERLDNHLSQFSTYKGNEDIHTIKKTLEKRSEELLYQSIKNSYDACFASEFKSYDDAVHKLNELSEELNYFYGQSKTVKNKQLVENYLNQIVNSLHQISDEQQDYYDAMASKDIVLLELFLENHPTSVMQHNVKDMIDEIYYTELLGNYNRNVESIEELNENMQLATDYLYKFYNKEKKSSVAELVNYMETLRRPVLEKELESKLDLLFHEMEEEAANIAILAFKDHSLKSAKMLSNSKEEGKYSSKYLRNYEVKLSKEYFGFSWREQIVHIEVEGKIQGDLQNGAIISVKGKRIS